MRTRLVRILMIVSMTLVAFVISDALGEDSADLGWGHVTPPTSAEITTAKAAEAEIVALLRERAQALKSGLAADSDDPRQARRCVDRMQVLEARVKAVNEKVEGLPPRYFIYLQSAAGGLRVCVGLMCLPGNTSSRSCNTTNEDLAEYHRRSSEQ